jgi:hypothetical protein
MAGEATPLESEFALFSRFSRAFGHVMRGDLSVITNEIAYLATVMPVGELERAKNRSAQMAATVSKIAGLETDLEFGEISARELAHIFGARDVLFQNSPRVMVDRVKVERLALTIKQLVGCGESACDMTIGDGPHQEALELRIALESHSERPRQFSSWSSFASRERGERSVIDGVVADLIARAHSWTVSIKSDGTRLLCIVSIPCSRPQT